MITLSKKKLHLRCIQGRDNNSLELVRSISHKGKDEEASLQQFHKHPVNTTKPNDCLTLGPNFKHLNKNRRE